MFPKPSDRVDKFISMPRCERDWLNSHKEVINFNGLVQEIIARIIEIKDPQYYEKYRSIIEGLEIRKLERTQILLHHLKVET